jgi:hypothetical protein
MVRFSPQKDAMDATNRGLSGHHTQLAIPRDASTPVGPGVWTSMSTTKAQGHPCRGLQVIVGFTEAIEDWPMQNDTP